MDPPALSPTTPKAALPFTAPWLLAPMEGVTEPCFRELVLSRNAPEHLGGTFTEFVRVVQGPVPAKVLRRHLGPALDPQGAPVGLQLMGADIGASAATARAAEACGARVVDLNFGCPAKGALRACAGSALLQDPRAVEDMVRACVEAVERVPVTAKIRAGFDDAERVEDLARAVEAGGAALLTVHCRTRAEAYCEEVDWTRIARAVAAVAIPVCGNGSARVHGDLERMRSETGCAFVMVGRGALADPWVFSGARVGRAEAARFLLEYAETIERRTEAGSQRRGPRAVPRLKQLLGHWTAGGLVRDEEDRRGWLREREAGRLLARLAEVAAEPSRG